YVLALNSDHQIYGWGLCQTPNGDTYNKPHKILLNNDIELKIEKISCIWETALALTSDGQMWFKVMYKTLENIGSGGFGVVNKVEYKQTGKIYARKECLLLNLEEDQNRNLCDFGLSKLVDVLNDEYKQSSVENTDISKNNVNYMAPEAQSGTNYNHLVDVYSLALIGAKIFGFETRDIRDGVYIEI
ncbi:unnamed protein product, partial [Medioppia subpectinata]